MLSSLVDILNENKTKVLEYAFYGINNEFQPKFLIGVEYNNNKRTKISFFEITKIINYLETQTFKIKKSKTVIALGDKNAITLQRKGGDGGKKSSNQLQFKITISSLNEIEHIEYKL